ncbi:MAG: DNA-deoxyinosine glycosylase [Clostridiaceae bacterium]|jgi:hypoxanthine-DNA glycosylase|nr:DNA-deoxyinosine glycosylase [Clostridiaceae bacterium]
MTKQQVISHPIAPVYDENSHILILGSFPSVKSREIGFYYGHPQNRFWPLLADIFLEKTPQTVESQRAFLLRNRIAVWDVIASCRIEGSADSSISDVIPNDLRPILEKADIREIYANGGTAARLFQKYQEEKLGRQAIRLPSTSPANARWSFDRLLQVWKMIYNSL